MNVLVTGVGGPAGRAAFEYFSSFPEHKVWAADMRLAAVQSIARHVVLPGAKDSWFAEMLLRRCAENHIDFLVCTVTEELPAVARVKRYLEYQGCQCAISAAGYIDRANDKLESAKHLRDCGVAAPFTTDSYIIGLGYPCLSKPRWGRGGRGVTVHRCLPEDTHPKDTVWQEFIPGTEYSVNLFIEEWGGCSAIQVLKKTALKDGITGNAVAVEKCVDIGVEKKAVAACKALNLWGPLDVDVREDGAGVPFVLEVNARIGANVPHARAVMDALHYYARKVVAA